VRKGLASKHVVSGTGKLPARQFYWIRCTGESEADVPSEKPRGYKDELNGEISLGYENVQKVPRQDLFVSKEGHSERWTEDARKRNEKWAG
jgi:hypothetical protein